MAVSALLVVSAAAQIGGAGSIQGVAGNNGHRLAGGPRGIWDNQIRPEHLVLGNLLQRPATAANLAEARRILPSIGLPYANFEGTISQRLRPFPQYSAISDILGERGQYPLELAAGSRPAGPDSRLDRQLQLHLLLNTGWASEETQTPASQHVVNVMAVYELPFGGNSGRVVRALANGWRISGITTY